MALSFDEELAHFERELSGDLPSPPADTVTGNEVNTAAAEESAPKLQKRKTPPTNAKVSLASASSCAYNLIRMVEQAGQAAEGTPEHRCLRYELASGRHAR
jgi:hypothetical protein